MTRATIDVGIDLGTTNSAIAVLRSGAPEPIRIPGSGQIMPSAVKLDRDGGLEVGQAAYQVSELKYREVAREFKRAMGTDAPFTLSGQQRTPEQLSAEVLRVLRGEAEVQIGEPIPSAVITVPAMFTLAASEATTRAAALAGFGQVELLQEPIAAGIAYGVASGATSGYWVVYDLGGGTFDSALLSIRDGRLQSIDHAGDDLLGGKNLDEALLDYVVDQLRRQYGYRFEGAVRRSDDRRRHKLYAVLKMECERAKIRLTREESVRVSFHEDDGLDDDDGREIVDGVTVTRATYESLIAPLVDRTTTLTRELLARNSLDARHVGSVIMVGGPTVTPFIRQRVRERVGVELETRLDPMIIVAMGAAMYAGGVLRRQDARGAAASLPSGAVSLELKYEPVSDDVEALIGGVVPSGLGLEAGTIQFERSDGGWASPRLPLKDRRFMTSLALRPRQASTFTVRLFDPSGRPVQADPSSVTITHGLVIDEPPLSRDLGIAVEQEDAGGPAATRVMLRRGTRLPATARHTFKTTRLLAPGTPARVELHLVEGESTRADRNDHVGYIRLDGSNITQTVPSGSDVEVRIEVDRSRKIAVRAFVPSLDRTFDLTIADTARPTPDANVLRAGLRAEEERLARLRGVTDVGAAGTDLDALDRAVDEARRGDADAAFRAQRDLHAMQERLDRISEQNGSLLVQREWNELLPEVRELLTQIGEPEDRTQLLVIEREWGDALAAGSGVLMRQKLAQLKQLNMRVVVRRPEFWTGFFDYLVTLHAEQADTRVVRTLIEQGRAARSYAVDAVLRRSCRHAHPFNKVQQDHRQTWSVRG